MATNGREFGGKYRLRVCLNNSRSFVLAPSHDRHQHLSRKARSIRGFKKCLKSRVERDPIGNFALLTQHPRAFADQAQIRVTGSPS